MHAKGSGMEKREDGCGFKGPREGPCDETAYVTVDGHTIPHVIKLHRTSSTHAHTPRHARW